MRERSRRRVILSTALALALGAAVGSAWRLARRSAPAEPVEVKLPVIPPPPLRPLPPELERRQAEIQRLQRAGDFSAAAGMYHALLGELERRWGEDNIELAPFHYNHALALKLAGRRREALELAAGALARWPDSLQLRLFHATSLAEAALARNAPDEAAEEALRALLVPENHARLRGLRVELSSLQALRAELLVRARRLADALSAAEDGLALAPKDRRCRELKARLLAALQRDREALPLLEELAAERSDPLIELQLGSALLASGEAAPAWQKLSRLLADRDRPGVARLPESHLPALRLEGAKALLRLERPREAAELLLENLAQDPDDRRAVQLLARAARGLGAEQAAEALDARIRRLREREDFLLTAARARAAGFASSVPFYEARAATSIGDMGRALERLEEAIRGSPRNPYLHLELSRVRLLLGRVDLAEQVLREALRVSRSPLLTAELARILALQARRGEAEELLERWGPAADAAEGAASPPGMEAELNAATRRARAWLELGELEKAAGILAGQPEGAAPLEGILCRAEIALRQGRVSEAAALLSSSFTDLPGGPEWAAALHEILRHFHGRQLPDAGRDPSDLLDNARLILEPFRSTSEAAPGAGGAWSRLRWGHGRREELVARVRGRPEGDRDAIRLGHELLALYLELGAARKARELAWRLVSLRPREVEEYRRLAAVLALPEEVLARLQTIERALALAPHDAVLAEERLETRAFLGLEPR
jgi:predicted Zn-dependent protease